LFLTNYNTYGEKVKTFGSGDLQLRLCGPGKNGNGPGRAGPAEPKIKWAGPGRAKQSQKLNGPGRAGPAEPKIKWAGPGQ